MKGYDKEARIIWQGLCKELEDQIESIRVISNSIVTKMGATVISAFTSLKINIVASEDDIPL